MYNSSSLLLYPEMIAALFRADIILSFLGGKGHYLQLCAARVPQSRLVPIYFDLAIELAIEQWAVFCPT